MDRRAFSSRLLASAGAVSAWSMWPAHVSAQGAFAEGKDFTRLRTPAPVAAPAGKIELVDLFWYGCPHCHQFGPLLDAWLDKQPQHVSARRIPVALFGREADINHQKLYFTLEAMGLVETLHRKVFDEVHRAKQRLDKLDAIVSFMGRHGVDTAKFSNFFTSFSVQSKVNQATQLVRAYGVDGVPAIGVHGRYLTSPSMASSPERALACAEFLIERARKGS